MRVSVDPYRVDTAIGKSFGQVALTAAHLEDAITRAEIEQPVDLLEMGRIPTVGARV